MPNHYHFLARQESELSISDFMQGIFNSYSKAFNKINFRSGTLFEGPFKSIHISEHNYLVYLCRYIHRNPIDGKKPLVKNIEDWPYSNYLEWIGARDGSLLNRQFIKNEFKEPDSYKKFVLELEASAKIEESLRKYTID